MTEPKSSETPKGVQDPRAANQEERARSVEELSAQLKSLEGVDDDIADLLAHNWQRVVGALVLVLVGVWLYGGYRTTKDQQLHAASEQYQSVQTNFANLRSDDPTPTEGEANAPDATKSADALTAFRDEAKRLKDANAGSYAKFAELYQAAQAIRAAEFADAERNLQAFDVEKTAKQPAPKTGASAADRFPLELAAMLHARTMLGKDPVAGTQAARPFLGELAKNSRFVTVEALILLGRIADSDETRASVQALAKQIAETRPELRQTIETELSALGISV